MANGDWGDLRAMKMKKGTPPLPPSPPPPPPCKVFYDAIEAQQAEGEFVVDHKTELDDSCLVDLHHTRLRKTQSGACDFGFSNSSIAFNKVDGRVEEADLVFPACFKGLGGGIRFYAEAGRNIPPQCKVDAVHMHAGRECPAVHVHMKCGLSGDVLKNKKGSAEDMAFLLRSIGKFTELTCPPETMRQ